MNQSGRWGPYRQASPSPAQHRPGAQSARWEGCFASESQTNREWENERCHSTVGCRTSAPPLHRAEPDAIMGDGARNSQRQAKAFKTRLATPVTTGFVGPGPDHEPRPGSGYFPIGGKKRDKNCAQCHFRDLGRWPTKTGWFFAKRHKAAFGLAGTLPGRSPTDESTVGTCRRD